MHLNLEPYLKPFCKYPICEFLGRHLWINRRKENPCCFVLDTPLQEGACKFIILPVCYNKLYLILRVNEVDIFHQEAPVLGGRGGARNHPPFLYILFSPISLSCP